MRPDSYSTPSGIVVERTFSKIAFERGLRGLLHKLDTQRGIYLSSGYEYPERYSRWDVAAVAPPLEIVAADRDITLRPLNSRGEVINRLLEPVLRPHTHWESFEMLNGILHGRLKPLPDLFPEEERSKQPSAFSLLRALLAEFHDPLAGRLALVGAFGYDLLFQFEPIPLRLPRDGHKDLQLFLCDDIVYMDRKREQIEQFTFEFERDGVSTRGLERTGERIAPAPIRERCSSADQISAKRSSVGVCGAEYLAASCTNAGVGNAFLSIFPFSVSGNSFRSTNADGIM